MINLSDLIVVCRSESKMDVDLVDKIKRNLKMQKVNAILEKIIKKSSHEQQRKRVARLSWRAKLLSTIVQNLTVTVSNIHIRFEDCSLCSRKPFSFGITVG